jgi:outer membrane protein assembly factor BamA
MMRYLIIIWIVLSPYKFSAQKTFSINFSNNDFLKVNKHFKLKYSDSLKATISLENLKIKALNKGYLLSGIDRITYDSHSVNVDFYLGKKWNKIQIATQLKNQDIPKLKSFYKEKALVECLFRPKVLFDMMLDLENDFLNAGFPFCKIYLDSLNTDSNIPFATLNIEPGKRYKISDIIVKGDTTISPILVSMITGIRKGDVYNHNLIGEINNTILQQSYIEQIKPEEFLFTDEGLEIYFYLKAKGISSINGALGLQPNQNNTKIALTGEINLKLVNVLRRSESFQLTWRNIQYQTQSLSTSLNLPYLFHTPFGIDGQFNLYKRDSTFIELRSLAGINYLLKNGLNVKVFYQNFTSTILASGNVNGFFQNLSNVKTDSYGIGLLKRSLDYIPNPTKGFILNTDVTIGNRKSRLNDTLEWTNNTTYKMSFALEWYIPLYKRNIIKLSNKSEFYYAPEVYQNELFRFGGLQTLRGFNEEELFASSKSVFSIEYRFLLDKNSNVFAFYDQAFYENNSSTYRKDHPFGFGAGLSFGTNLGIFSISLAVGKQLENPILLRNSRVHFGYIAYF